jgi:amino-acid N-acetyltransferase
MTTRDATDRDWDAISALLRRRGLPLDGARDYLAHFIVAVDDEGLAGVAGLEVYGESALLRSIVAAHDGRGIGHVLVEQLIARARALGVTDLVLLTTTAAGYFPRFGFETVARTDVPEALLASREFQGACPSSATVMRRRLVTHD